MLDILKFFKKKHTATQWLLIILLLFMCTSATTVSAQSRGITMVQETKSISAPYLNGTYRALIIGNNNYQDSDGRWLPLRTPVIDARALKNLLQENYGFSDVQLLENATRRDVLIALQELSKRVVANDSVVVYYAGHGFLDLDTNRGYWVPVDAQGIDQTTFLRNSTIRDELSIIASRSKHTLLISDSCFSGTLLRSSTRGLPYDTSTDQYYKKVANKKSVQIMAAGGVEYVDDDYNRSGHSPFTYFLLSELKNNDLPLLTVSELSNSVEKAVANNVEQVPESGVLQDAGDELGEFIFIKVDVSVEGVPADKVKVQVNVVDAEPEQSPPSKNDFSLSFGLKLLGTGWKGSNEKNNTDFEADGGQLGLNIALQKGHFYTGIDIQSGTYSFNNNAPDQVTETGTQSSSDVKISHTELDFVVGYYFWQNISFFVDLKGIGDKWDNNDHEMNFAGLGLGVSGVWPLGKKWDLFGSIAIIPSANVETYGNKMGKGNSGTLELGAAYNFNASNRLGLGLKLQSHTYDFNSGDKQKHQMNGLFLSYNYIFLFN